MKIVRQALWIIVIIAVSWSINNKDLAKEKINNIKSLMVNEAQAQTTKEDIPQLGYVIPDKYKEKNEVKVKEEKKTIGMSYEEMVDKFFEENDAELRKLAETYWKIQLGGGQELYDQMRLASKLSDSELPDVDIGEVLVEEGMQMDSEVEDYQSYEGFSGIPIGH